MPDFYAWLREQRRLNADGKLAINETGNPVASQEGGGAIAVTGTQGGEVAVATGLLALGMVTEPTPGVAAIQSAVISAEDPGPVGAGALWMRNDDNYGIVSLFVRNADNTGWMIPAFAAYGPDGTNLTPTAFLAAESGGTVALYTQGTAEQSQTNITMSATAVSVQGSSKTVTLGGAIPGHLHLGSAGVGPSIGTGSVDPSAAAGVTAVIGSLYLRTGTAQLWLKTSAPDTGWTQIT